MESFFQRKRSNLSSSFSGFPEGSSHVTQLLINRFYPDKRGTCLSTSCLQRRGRSVLELFFQVRWGKQSVHGMTIGEKHSKYLRCAGDKFLAVRSPFSLGIILFQNPGKWVVSRESDSGEILVHLKNSWTPKRYAFLETSKKPDVTEDAAIGLWG